MKIAIAGTRYVGLSNAILLAQHNEAQEMESDPISSPFLHFFRVVPGSDYST